MTSLDNAVLTELEKQLLGPGMVDDVLDVVRAQLQQRHSIPTRCAHRSQSICAELLPIVQTPRYVLLYTELVHDVRIVRIGGTHKPSAVRDWLGDSVGHWDGDTLVVDTSNFNGKIHFRGSSERLHVTERFTRVDTNTIRHRATIEDPDTWTLPWTIEYPFRRTSQPVLEYACHEGNYAIENALRGHRAHERERK